MGCLLAGTEIAIMLYAKSDGTTLKQHITDCLVIWRELKKALPILPLLADLPGFWEMLFLAVFFHDFGKAHIEFQKVLSGDAKHCWEQQRHEVYSVPFVDKAVLPETMRLLIKRAVLAHHKNFKDLYDRYYPDEEMLNAEYELHYKTKGHPFHPRDFGANLCHKLDYGGLHTITAAYNELAGQSDVSVIPIEKKVQLKEQGNPYALIAAEEIVYDIRGKAYWQNMLLWGALKICDHYGSAGISRLYTLNGKNFIFLDKLKTQLLSENSDIYTHQKQCWEKEGNCLLIAPTGSGKTEAALGWLRLQIRTGQGRAFYVLPYTASINAMHKRLSAAMDAEHTGSFPSNIVGLEHGKLLQYLAASLEEDSYAPEELLEFRNNYRKIIQPLKIVTPFQLLKYFFGVKGFEMGYVQLAGAMIIFDEIHAYDVTTFTQIVVMLKYLVNFFRCRILIMTATLPGFMIEELEKIIDIRHITRADIRLQEKMIRHKLKIAEGTLFEKIMEISACLDKKQRIIIACNTVKNAQAIYGRLKAENLLRPEEITLIHSRFNAEDRGRNELKAFSPNTKLLIGTQAIEVSLDLDYDVLFTEPAPLDALLQRFGRINRKGERTPAPVCIVRQGGEGDCYIYDSVLIERTLSCLEKVELLKETEIQAMLDFVYPGWDEKQLAERAQTAAAFEHAVQSLQPYTAHKEEEEEFYSQFTNVSVLPAGFLDEYTVLITAGKFIEAERLLVSIHVSLYHKLKNRKQLIIRTIAGGKQKTKHQNILCVLCKYDPDTGLTEEAYANDGDDHNDNFI